MAVAWQEGLRGFAGLAHVRHTRAMLTRRKSLLTRAGEAVPFFAVAGVGVAAVFMAMNVLVTWAPIIVASPSSSTSAAASVSASASTSFGAPATPTPSFSPAPTASLPSTKPTVVSSAIKASDPNGTWSVYLGYPAFLAGTTPWAASIDADISGEVQTTAAQWETGPAANRQAGVKLNTLYGSYTMDLLSPALASFTLTWADDSYSGPPALGVETFTYDLGTGQRLAFGDVFPDSTSALAAISTEARSLLHNQLGAGYVSGIADDGTNPTVSNFGNWAVTKDGIKFTFGQYQVTADPTAQPSVLVSWDVLRPVMVQTGPVAKVAGF